MFKKNERGAGRKPVPLDEKKNCTMQFRVTASEKEKINLFLNNKGLKLREFILKNISVGGLK